MVKILPSGPVVRHRAFTGKDLVSIPGQGTKTPKAAWYGHKKKKCCLKLQSYKVLPNAGDSISRVAVSHAWQVSAGC